MLFRIASLRLRIPGPREGQLKKSSPSVDFAILCDERKEKNYARVSSAFLPFKCVALDFFQKRKGARSLGLPINADVLRFNISK